MMNKLIFRYLQENKAKACGEIVSVVIAIALMLFICNSSVWYYSYMKNIEIELNGGWQVRFYDLDEKQIARLKTIDGINHISEYKDGNLYNVDVEFEQVDKGIFERAEDIGRSIEMKTMDELEKERYMPNGEKSTYDVSFHMELLDFYGVTYENNQVSIEKYFLSILAITTLIFSIFIYNIFRLSYNDKKKYIGILGCIGASVRQRRYFVLGEELFTGIIGIFIGMLVGILGTMGALPRMEKFLTSRSGVDIQDMHYLDKRVLFGVFILGCILIFLLSVIPTIRAGRVIPLQIVKIKEEKSIHNSSFNIHRSVERNLAIKNFLRDGKRTFAMILMPALLVFLSLNGYVYVKMQNGDYLLRDRREKEALSAWVTLHSEGSCDTKRIYDELSQKKELENVRLESVLNLGSVLIDKEFVQKNLDEFMLYGMLGKNPIAYVNGEKVDKKLYAYNTKIIGVDETSFLEYASKCGIDVEKLEDADYPVIIEDYLPIECEGKTSYRSTLNIENPGNMKILFGKYGDAVLLENQVYISDENQVQLDVLGTTDEAYVCPETPDEYETKLDTYSQIGDSYIKIYMPYQSFEKFLLDDQIMSVYGEMPQDANPVMWREGNKIETYIFFSSELGEEKELEIFTRYFIEQDIRKYEEANAGNERNTDICWDYGNVSRIQKEQFQHPEKLLKKIFVIGAVLFVLVFILSAWIDYLLVDIRTRKKEFVILKSIGMNETKLSRMIVVESTIALLAALVVGNAIGYAFVVMMFYEYSHSVACRITLPWEFTIVETVMMFAFIVLINILSVKVIKKLNVVEYLKSELR